MKLYKFYKGENKVFETTFDKEKRVLEGHYENVPLLKKILHTEKICFQTNFAFYSNDKNMLR